MKGKKTLLTILVVVLLLGGFLGCLLFQPLVVFVRPNVPSELAGKFTYPSFFQKGYVALPLTEKQLSLVASVKKPKLVVYTPLSKVETERYHTLQWGTLDSKADLSVTLNAYTMWRDALKALGDQPVAMLFERFDNVHQDLFQQLEKEFPNLKSIVFDGRISGINMDSTVSQMDAFYAILAPSVTETEEALRKTRSRVVMDEREAVSIVTFDRIVAVTLDWTKIIPEALKKGNGTLESHYTLSVLH